MNPPTIRSLAGHLAAAAARWPEALALAAGGRQWTFGALADHAGRIGAALSKEDSGAIIALAAGNGELALAAYACSAAGRPFWPLDPAGWEQRWPAWSALAGPGLHRLERLPAPGPAPLRTDGAPTDPALVIGTSGSEGAPKAVMLSAANLDAAAAAANATVPLQPGDGWLACLPQYHVGGQAILWRCARTGAAVLVHDRFTVDAVGRNLEAGAASHISLVPAMLAALLAAGVRPSPRLRVALVGGAALSADLWEGGRAAGWPLFPTWGMSETAAQAATFGPGDGPWHPGCVGRPLPGNEVAIGGDSRICVRGPQVMLGYLNPERRPGTGLDNGWLVTGDRGRFDDHGRLVVLGRADDMLVSGGCNVHPADVEAQLARCPGVREVAVTGLPDPVWGDALVALVVGPVAPEALIGWGREHLPPPARPRRMVAVPALPLTPLGKLDRPALRRLAAESRQ